jgi:RNA polymerase sigma-70 factor (ECF subfamily)
MTDDLTTVQDRTFAALYQRHAAVVHRFCHCFAGPDLAEDLLSDTFLRAFHHRRQVPDDDAAARRWLLRIARNLAVDQHRRTKRQQHLLTLLGRHHQAAGTDPHDVVVTRSQLDTVLMVLADLSSRDRTFIALRAAAELSLAEIAAVTGSSVPAVQMGLQRARLRLRARAAAAIEEQG